MLVRPCLGAEDGCLIEPVLVWLYPKVEIQDRKKHALESVHLAQVNTSCFSVVAIRVNKILVVLCSSHEACQEDAVDVPHCQRKAATVVLQQTVNNDQRRHECSVAALEV